MGVGNLLYWALIFLVVAVVAGFLGFGGAAGAAQSAASLIFYVAIVLLIISLIMNFVDGERRSGTLNITSTLRHLLGLACRVSGSRQ